jgi:hypothetical protein
MFFFDLRILVTPLVSTNSCFGNQGLIHVLAKGRQSLLLLLIYPPCYSYSQVELDTTRYKYLTLDIYNLIVVLINFPKGHSEKIHCVIIRNCMSNTVGILKEGEGTVYLSRAHGLNPGFLEVDGSLLLVVLAWCVMFLFCLSLFCVLCLMLPVSLEFPFFIAVRCMFRFIGDGGGPL